MNANGGGVAAWLVGSKPALPHELQTQLKSGLYASLPIFLGGVLNSVAIAALAAWRHEGAAFQLWLAIELALAATRLPLLAWNRRALRRGRSPLEALAVYLSCAWAGSIGFGAFLAVTSGDWVLTSIICLSTAAMVCGICLRNFGTPRLAAAMMALALLPCAVGGLLSPEPVVAVIAIQLPVFMVAIFSAAFAMHRMLVSRMEALGKLERSEFFTQTILSSSPDYTLILDRQGRVVFANHPDGRRDIGEVLLGLSWIDLLPPEDREAGVRVLERMATGQAATLVTSHDDEEGRRRWFHTAANPVADGTGRTIVVARDISQQKHSEDRALWMALHDPLTALPNRTLLQDALDTRFADPSQGACGLLILDVDNFKTINDTLGHDAGDALLCAFAERLRAASEAGDLVTRTGGDEFALVVKATNDAELEAAAERIYAALREPFVHAGRLLDCSASIGGSLLPRDGHTRSDILKAADIALYAAKAGGRAQLRIFRPEMKAEVVRRDEMMALAREALAQDRIVPFFQPKICLRTWRIAGFEALLRWTDGAGAVRGPEDLAAAFEDLAMASALSDRMIERTLDRIQSWQRAGVPFHHVTLNSSAADFRRPGFAERLLAQLAQRDLQPQVLQLEVTETVFLGRGATFVEEALRTLSAHGIKVALDDFGTGYASLSHLSQFPIDTLKIDQSFVAQLGRCDRAGAIAAAVVNLAHGLGMEVIAEGVETAAQERQLLALGCDGAQGYYYSSAMPAEAVSLALMQWEGAQRRQSA